MKKTQAIMVWLLPLIVIGGLFNPLLGYLVVAMMVFFLTLSFFAGRYWCRNLCPRGAFLDIVISKFSLNKSVPKIFLNQRFRLSIFVFFMALVILRIFQAGGDLFMIGAVFVSACILTTVIAVILGVSTRHRAWCAVCPMGFLQEKIGRLNRKRQ